MSDLYIDIHYFRRRYHLRWWLRLLWWVPCIAMVVYTCAMASIHNFAPADLTWLNTYLFLVGMFVGPKAVFAVCSFIGWIVRKFITHTHTNWGHYTGVLLGIFAFASYVYGLIVGVGQITVRHVNLYFKELPASFDGYRIMHVSDLHLGTFKGWREKILKAEMDSIRKQDVDLICFTGDLQNMRPEEVSLMVPILYPAMKGAVSVLGNHDYAEYVKHEPEQEEQMRRQLLTIQRRQLRWDPLINTARVIMAPNGTDQIFICGTENDGKPPFPNRSDYHRAMKGIGKKSFVIMLQHDPSAWRRSVLPKTTAQLTLSGHTHGGQMQVFGWRPTQTRQQEDWGLYEQDGRYLYVNAGLGGLVPFRLNMPNEITIITLHQK